MKKFKPGDRLADRYEIRAQIGLGGQGVVYEAHDRRLDRAVAIKIMRPAAGADAESDDAHRTRLERFRREAQTLAQLTHPGIINVFDYGEIGETVYIVTEHFDGVAVDEWGARERPTVSEWLQVARQILAALQYAHQRGVIHRDVKPSNVLMRGGKDAPEIKLIDWGVAFAQKRARLTTDGAVVGTLGMSMDPAHFLDAERLPSPPSDLYAFGTLLYHLLCRASPWRVSSSAGGAMSSDADAAINLYFEDVIAPHVANPQIPSAVSDVVMSLMNLDPEARPATATEALKMLDDAEAGGVDPPRPLAAVPPAGAPRSAVANAMRAGPGEAPRTMAIGHARLGEYEALITLNTKDALGDREWKNFVEKFLAFKAATGGAFANGRGLAFIDFGAPTIRQRVEIKKMMEGHPLKTAIISNSHIVRGVITAMRWTNPSMRCFHTAQLREALAFIDLAAHEAEVRRVAGALQDELPVKVMSLTLALRAAGPAAG